MTRVVHRTRYTFEDAVAPGSQLETCLAPPSTSFHQLLIRPLPGELEVSVDDFGNTRHHARFDEPLHKLDVTATSVLGPGPPPPLDPAPFLAASARAPLLPACAAYARGHDIPSLLRSISSDFAYDTSATDLDTPLARFVALRRGVCQDFAHFTLACLRARGIPARYVSGYSDASPATGHTHAWVSAHLDGRWLDLDPTLGQVGPLEHIPLATGRDYDDVPPLRGTLPQKGRCRLESTISIA